MDEIPFQVEPCKEFGPSEFKVTMTIHHRLNLWADIALPFLDSFGLSFSAPPREDGHILIPDISENDPSWPRIAFFLEEYHRAWAAHPRNSYIVGRYASSKDPLADFALAKFSKAERRAAQCLALDASDVGFPRPEGRAGVLSDDIQNGMSRQSTWC